MGAAQPAADDQEQPDDTLSPEAVARQVHGWWKKSTTHLNTWRTEAIENYDFVAGHQWTDDEIKTLQDQLRPVITFNRIGPMHDAVMGYEINGRQTIVAHARDAGPQDAGAAFMETEAIRWLRDEGQAEDEESDAFSDVFVTGYGWTNSRMDYDEDPMGLVDHSRVDPLSMRYDPTARKRNLVDARWVIHGEWKDKSEAENMWPGKSFTQTPADGANDPLDHTGGPVNVPENNFYTGTGTEQGDNTAGKVFVMEAQWWELKPFFMVLNPQSMKLEQVDEKTHATLKAQAAKVGQPVLSRKMQKRQYYRAFVSGGECLEVEEWACPKFSYQCITGKRDRNSNTFYGLVRAMKDPQRWANKWLSQTLHIVNSNAKGGFLAEEGVFTDVEAAEAKLAKPGPIIEVAQGRMAGIKDLPTAQLPTATFQLTQFAINSMRDTTGVNVELLGMTDRDQAGVLEAQRKQSAMTILAPLFDSLRRYRKNVGLVYLHYIQKYIPAGRLVRVVGEDGAKYVPLVKAPDTVTFDVIVDEAPTSPNQKEAVFASLLHLLPALMKAGIMLPPEIIDYIPGLPAPLAEKIRKKAMEPNPDADMAKKLEAEKAQADTAQAQADAQYKAAQAEEIRARTIVTLNGGDGSDQAKQVFEVQKMKHDADMEAGRQTVERDKLQLERERMLHERAMAELAAQNEERSRQYEAASQAQQQAPAEPDDQNEAMAIESVNQGISQLGADMGGRFDRLEQALAQIAGYVSAETELYVDPKTGKKRARKVIPSQTQVN